MQNQNSEVQIFPSNIPLTTDGKTFFYSEGVGSIISSSGGKIVTPIEALSLRVDEQEETIAKLRRDLDILTERIDDNFRNNN